MPYVRRICKNQIRRWPRERIRDKLREITLNDIQSKRGPQVPGGITESRVKLHAQGSFYSPRAKHFHHGRKKTACADSRVHETNRPQFPTGDGFHVASDLHGKPVWSCELSQAVPLSGRLACIQCSLYSLPARLNSTQVFNRHLSYSPSLLKSSILCSHTQSIPSAAS